ncbi:hypothetical protein V6N12_057344 [Hibiscus sabdariffa]|uniref:Uncharacterized protein n=1 Tax=Hibiscus sabdariffa TaxID=183260 RepID=A0ABR2DBM5_9ROSI
MFKAREGNKGKEALLIAVGREVRKCVREWRVESALLNERERECNGSLEEERKGEREEKKGLEEKREEDRGGKEMRVLEEVMRDLSSLGMGLWLLPPLMKNEATAKQLEKQQSNCTDTNK